MVDKILRLDTNVINTAYNLKLYQGSSRGKTQKRRDAKSFDLPAKISKKKNFYSLPPIPKYN